ncbi:MAG: hypothetical protein DRJ35_04940 [Thermoprotei archaeon]|nr:MAG: hypothetical protein DRJ35_04940 [Thermoprotei archaeon]
MYVEVWCGKTPIGKLCVATKGRYALIVEKSERFQQRFNVLYGLKTALEGKNARRLFEEILEYFYGKRKEFGFRPYLSNLSQFTKCVLEYTQKIPYGKTVSYSQLATMLGKPGAARAVGQALKRNPVPIIVPCHRVIKSNGELGGFVWGVETKKFLLDLEKRFS